MRFWTRRKPEPKQDDDVEYRPAWAPGWHPVYDLLAQMYAVVRNQRLLADNQIFLLRLYRKLMWLVMIILVAVYGFLGWLFTPVLVSLCKLIWRAVNQ